jgi:hypothetical protein
MADKLVYMGPPWPFANYKVGESYTKNSMQALFDSVMALRTSVRAKFDAAVEKVRADNHLTDLGKQAKLRVLVEEYREHPRVLELQSALNAQRERAEDLRERLMAKAEPSYVELTPYQQVSLAMSEQRKIAAFEALDSLERMKAAHAASERGDHKYLALMLREQLLPEPMSKVVELALQKQGDKDSFRALEALLGKVQAASGERDPMTGALPVSEYSLAKFFEYLDKEIGKEGWQRETEETVKAATAKDGTIRLTREQVDTATYELARARARETNGTFIITSDEGDTVVTGPYNSGFDQTALAPPAGMQVAPNGNARDGGGQ